MGTIVYENLVELLLEEGDMTQEEIINEAVNRFGFEKEKIVPKIKIALSLNTKYNIKKLPDGKYHLDFMNKGVNGRESYLKLLRRAPKNYFEQRPEIRKLKEALEERVEKLTWH